MIHEEICTYEVCKLAKENGFNCKVYNYYQATKHYCETLRGIVLHSECWKLETDDCYSRYNKGSEDIVSAPAQSLLQRWLREEKGYYVYPYYDNNEFKWTYSIREKTGDMWILLVGETSNFDKYEDAMEAGLKFVLENLV